MHVAGKVIHVLKSSDIVGLMIISALDWSITCQSWQINC